MAVTALAAGKNIGFLDRMDTKQVTIDTHMQWDVVV